MNGVELPAVSVIMPVYRNTPYLKPALESVLAQDYTPLQIVICDDASPDDAFEVLQAVVAAYKGPHEIVLERNDRNLSMGNYNRLMDRAAGAFIVVAHDDDIARSDRVTRLVAAWRESGASLISSNATVIDGNGDAVEERFCPDEGSGPVSSVLLAREGWQKRTLGATFGWSREVFEVFGPIDINRTVVSSDHLLPFRAALLKGAYFLDEPLIAYRRHGGQRTEEFMRASSGPDSARAESMMAQGLIQIAYQLHELDVYASRGLVHWARALYLRRLVTGRLRERLPVWARHRNRLLAEKKSPQWLVKGKH